MTEDRSEYRDENGIAAWWVKDGAWHVARPVQDGHINPGNLLWTAEAFDTREQAITALKASV
jgi:hypothetical protein